MPITKPNMDLPVPVPGETDYPTNVNTCFTHIDDHDHSAGKGVKIVTGGIEDDAITSDLIADDAVITDKIADDAVTTDKVADGAITRVQLDSTTTTSSFDCSNLTISATVGSSALTIALKTIAGTDASAADPIVIGARSSTLANGTYFRRSVTGALSIVVSSGSTLGHTSGVAWRIYLYAIIASGVVELAVSSTLLPLEGRLTTTAEGGAGGADSFTAIYSTTARTNVSYRLIGILVSTQTTAGTWAAVPSQIDLLPFNFNHLHSVAPNAMNVASALIAISGGTPSVTSQDGAWISSLTDNGAGDTTLNLTAGFFSAAPRVTGAGISSATRNFMLEATPTTSAARCVTRAADGTKTDSDFNVIAMGDK